MKTTSILKTVLFFLMILLSFSSCNKDESPELEEWEVEVNTVMNASSRYMDINVALDEGFIDVSGYVPNMGHHYLNPARSDEFFELEKPEIILYVPDSNGVMQMVAVEYSIIPAQSDNPGNPPEGFTGDLDAWHFNEDIGQWQLHVWTQLENPEGIFAPFNPTIGD